MELQEASAAFACLGQDTRLLVLRTLLEHGPSGLAAGDLAALVDIPASTLSFHLSALERTGLVQSTRQGRQVVYAARIARMRALIVFLTETCCAGQPGLCGDIAELLPTEQETGMTPALNVLFLCTANSARSVMAEAILDKVGAGRFNAFSAGSNPADAPRADVMEKLRVLGHDVSQLRSKSWNEFTGDDAPRMDFVIALCDTLDGQACPDFGERAVTGAWPLPDPAKFSGCPAEQQTLMNELYGSLKRRIEIFTSLPFPTLDRMAVKARLDEIGAGARV